MPLPPLYNEQGEQVNPFRELGRSRSEAKAKAARINGAKGGPKSWKRKPKAKAKKLKRTKPVTGTLTPVESL